MTDVEAIVITYNSEDTIGACLAALGAAGVSVIRVIDNGSEDDTVGIATEAGGVLRESAMNVGFGAAANALLADVTTDFALLVNPDCIVTHDCVRRLGDALAEDATLAAVVPRMLYPDGTFGIAGAGEPSVLKEALAFLRLDALAPRRVRAWLPSSRSGRLGKLLSYANVPKGREPADVDWVCGWCMLVRVAAVRSIGGFDEDFFLYFEDADLCRRLRSTGHRVAIVGGATALHFESLSTLRSGKRALYARGMRVYFEKHGNAPARFFSRLLASLMGA